MRVRIRETHREYWIIDIWRWWWPFWIDTGGVYMTQSQAYQAANRMLHPTIEEVK